MRLHLTVPFTLALLFATSQGVRAADLPPVDKRDDVKPRNVVFILTDDQGCFATMIE
ncbi:hypothetical protein [Allorhodopirellula solitaria]|uniref:Uncharacterized protein n=1 Tax=Allorhodopirellula solitaria TaxID=2527987 RepID=A0A5C5WZ99_9BACT|nr:hypothetical protein [Allorhodopirellula solitaria]TWT55976.1 hypothetical protein CA85_46840 [Allorhodopirellula solitaria]